MLAWRARNRGGWQGGRPARGTPSGKEGKGKRKTHPPRAFSSKGGDSGTTTPLEKIPNLFWGDLRKRVSPTAEETSIDLHAAAARNSSSQGIISISKGINGKSRAEPREEALIGSETGKCPVHRKKLLLEGNCGEEGGRPDQLRNTCGKCSLKPTRSLSMGKKNPSQKGGLEGGSSILTTEVSQPPPKSYSPDHFLCKSDRGGKGGRDPLTSKTHLYGSYAPNLREGNRTSCQQG